MNPIAAQQVALDNALVTPDNRICPKLPNQEFVVPPSSNEEIVSFIKELGYTGDIDFVSKVYTYHMHQTWRTFAAAINRCLSATLKKSRKFKKLASPSKKKTLVAIEEPVEKPAARRQSTGVQIRDTPSVSVSKKKAPAKAERSKGIELLFEAALLEEAHEGADLESEVPDEPKGKSIITSEGTGSKPRVPDVSKADSSESEYESWGDTDDDNDDDDQQSNDERTESDDDKSVDLNKTDDEEEAQENEFVHTPEDYVPTDDETDDVDDEEYDHINKEMYDDVNVELKDAEAADEEKGDEEMTHDENVNAEHEEVSQEVVGDQVKDDAQETVTAALATQKTEVPLQSSSIASDYATKFLNFDNIPSSETEIILMSIKLGKGSQMLKNVDHSSALLATIKSKVLAAIKEYIGTSLDDDLYKVHQRHTADLSKEHFIPVDVVEKLKQQDKPQKSAEDISKVKMKHVAKQQETRYTITSSDSVESQEFDQKKTLFETMTKTKSFNKNTKRKALYHALMESIIVDEDAMDKGVVDKSKKRKPDDADRDEGPLARPNQGLKRKKTGKDVEPSKKEKSTESSKGTTKCQPKSTGKSAQVEEIVFEAGDIQVPQNQGDDMGNTNEPPVLIVNPKDCFKKPERPPTPDPEWNECKIISDLTQDILVGPSYKILKGTCKSYVELEYNIEECYKALTDQLDWNNPERERTGRTYKTSLTKTKAAKYDSPGIEDLVPNLWSPIKVAYDKHALLGDFPRLHLNDIEDMLLLVVQNRLFNLKGKDISYQKKLNISKPRRRDEDLSQRAPYTTLSDPQGVIYEDKLNRKRLMHSDELYKFCDGTLQLVRDTLHDMATNLRIGYNKAMPKEDRATWTRHGLTSW
ncbi:hypothetical protein Tco_1192093 [Tanacetum coccineum]